MSVPCEAAFTPSAWTHRTGALSLERPRVMGIVNVTPDSFFDGGRLARGGQGEADAELAVRHCDRLVSEGADLLDIGGESTRPGAEPVGVEREIQRIVPVLERLRAGASRGADRVPVSVDTRHARVARRALAAGADIINDVSGLADPEMASVVAEYGAGLVVGHLRGDPQTMQRTIAFRDVLQEVSDELLQSVERAVAAGIERARIVVDPGVGFGKSAEQSAALVAAAHRLRDAIGCPVLIGASRKSFLRASTATAVEHRLVASLAAAVVAVSHGASVVRVHDVGETVEALRVAQAIEVAYARHAHGSDEERRR